MRAFGEGEFAIYDYQFDAVGDMLEDAKPATPQWLQDWWGTDFFHRVVVIHVNRRDSLQRVGKLRWLEELYVSCETTDADLDLKQSDIEKALGKPGRSARAVYVRPCCGPDSISYSGVRPVHGNKEHREFYEIGDVGGVFVHYCVDGEKAWFWIFYFRVDDTFVPLTKVSDYRRRLAWDVKRFEEVKQWLAKAGLPTRKMVVSARFKTDAQVEQVKKLPDLRRLDLHYSQVTDAGLAHLRGLTELQELTLFGTPVTAAGVKDLQDALPHAYIGR